MRAAASLGVAAGAAGQHGLAAHPPGVDRAERRCGESGEHARVRGDRIGNALAACEPGADELAGVALVDGRAGWADRLAAAAARDVQHSPGLVGRVVERGEFAGGQVDGVDAAAELDRVRAGGELVFPGAEVGPGDGHGVVVGGRPRPQAIGRSGDEGGCRGSHRPRARLHACSNRFAETVFRTRP